MDRNIADKVADFIELLGLDEEPLGLFYTDEKPEEGYAPEKSDLPTVEKERNNEIDWVDVFGKFSCAIGHIWKARLKKSVAYFSAEQFGCAGAAFWFGFNKPQAQTIIKYISSGIPNFSEGEFYCESPEAISNIFEFIDPRDAPKKYCVVKPLSLFEPNEIPELILFFSRPEQLCGLHQLATFVTNDPEVVMSPWSAGCGSIAVWPLHYLNKGLEKAVVGGWDPSARKYYKGDELSFTIPHSLFEKMIERYKESFLTKTAWPTVMKKINRSKKMWGELK